MVDIADFRFNDPGTSFRAGYGQVNALRQDQAKRAAGNALAGGDYASAAGDLYRNGDIAGGFTVANAGQAQDAMKAKTEADAQAGQVKAWADAAERLSSLHQQLTQQDPQNAVTRTLASFDQMAPQLKAAGVDDGDIAQARQHLGQDPQGTLTALGAGAAKQLGYDIVQTKDGDIVAVNKSNPKDTRLVASANVAAPQPPTGPTAAPTGAVAPASGPVDTDALWKAIKHQESGGQASPGTAVGPDTPYGNALGSTQMLPATAEAMARKLGVAWNPALMRENSPKALAYQDQLGRAYLQEGLDKNNGDPAAAAAYYFGGPDSALHGPKTAAYVQQVLARANPQPYNVAAAGGHLPPPPSEGPPPGTVDANGVLVLAPHQPDWQSDGHGNLINKKTGDRKVDPTAAGPEGSDASLTDDAVQLLAGKYINNGSLPPFYGKVGTENKSRILNAATKMAKDLGLTADDLVAGTANVKALGSALSKAQGVAQAMTSQESAAEKNADLMLSLAPKGGGTTNIPVVNRWIQAGRKNVAGDPDVTSFDSALGGFSEEFAKVMTGSNGSAAATDSARSAAADRLGKYATQGQLVAGVRTMKQEMANRKAAQYEVISGITSQIHNGGRGTPYEASPAPQAPAAADPLAAAREAIRRGADRDAVIQRLRQHGVDPTGL